MLTDTQISAVRWYIGDTEGEDPFWGDPKAYLVVNSLFFPGIGTEQCRAAEGKYLNPAILADTARLRAVLTELLAAFTPNPEHVLTYRVERMADFEAMRQRGGTVSFTSTSTAGYLPSYTDRRGIALMHFRLPMGTPCIRMAWALPHYAKADEAEVLLPPGMALRFTEQPLSPEMLRITDADGAPPRIYVVAEPCGTLSLPPAGDPTDGNLAGMCVLAALNEHRTPDSEDVERYVQWKNAFTADLITL